MKTLNKIIATTLSLMLASPAFAADRAEQNLPPEISHFPVTIAYRGQPIPVYARVTDKTGKIKSVSVFYALQQQAAPVEVKMKRLSDGRYSGAIPANFFHSSPTLWYFIEARDSFDDKAETSWTPVQIKDPDTNPTQDSSTPADAAGGNNPAGRTPASGSAAPGPGTAAPGTAGTAPATSTAAPGTGTAAPAAGTTAPGTAAAVPAGVGAQPVVPGVAAAASPAAGTVFPADAVAVSSTGGGIGTTGIIIGGVLIGGGVAVAAGGGGGGGGSSGGGGGGFDPSSAVIVNASGSASGGFSGAPQDKVINGTAAVGGKTITGVRVTVNYEAYSLPDKFEVIYNGNTIANSGVKSGSGSIQGTRGGSSPLVTIRVTTPDPGTAWNWSATVEFSAK